MIHQTGWHQKDKGLERTDDIFFSNCERQVPRSNSTPVDLDMIQPPKGLSLVQSSSQLWPQVLTGKKDGYFVWWLSVGAPALEGSVGKLIEASSFSMSWNIDWWATPNLQIIIQSSSSATIFCSSSWKASTMTSPKPCSKVPQDHWFDISSGSTYLEPRSRSATKHMFKLVGQMFVKVGIFDAQVSIAVGFMVYAHEGAFGPQSFSTCRTTQCRQIWIFVGHAT